MNDELRFSVAMSIYKNDDPDCLRTAIDSTYRQTLPPVKRQSAEATIGGFVSPYL